MLDSVPDGLLWGLLGYVVFPLWLAAGVADYVCHARTYIEHTAGVGESFLHVLQTAQVGVPVLAILFLEVRASVLILVAVGAATHLATAYWDIHFTAPLRRISPFEQVVHAFLIVLPLLSLAIILLLHWPQAKTLLAPGSADWSLQWRSPGFDPRVIFAVLTASLFFGVAPGLWEFRKTWRERNRGAAPSA